MRTLASFLFLAAAFPATAGADWRAEYIAGVSACDAGFFENCREHLVKALAVKPLSEAGADDGRGGRFDYTPHYHLALERFAAGDLGGARAELKAEEGAGVIFRTPMAGAFRVLLLKVAGDWPMPPPQERAWHDWYRDALRQCDIGNEQACIHGLNEALLKKPKGERGARLPELAQIDYFPHYRLGLAYFRQGAMKEARDQFDAELADGVIQTSPLVDELRAHRAEADEAVRTGRPTIPPLPATDPGDWYTYYQAGVAQCEAGDFSHCRASMRASMLRKPRSERSARTSGMNFIDYTPHYYLGWALDELGDREGARQELEREAELAIVYRTAKAQEFKLRREKLGLPGGAAPAAK